MKSVENILLIVAIIAQVVSSKPSDDDRIIFPDTFSEIIKDNNDDLSGSDDSVEEQGNIDLESGDLYQGDIHLSPEQALILSDKSSVSSRTGLLFEDMRWPKDENGHVVMPYTVDDASYSIKQKKLIERAMRGIEKNTCVRFVKRTDEENYVFIFSGGSCSSYLGMTGEKQQLSLKSEGCMTKGTIQHELIHALGYDHMHSHIDRDRFIEIKWQNMADGVKTNFEKVDPKIFGNFGTAYDLFSVTHYHSTAFSKNGKETIVPRDSKYARAMGQRVGISSGDVKRINRMYKCSGVRII